jgi:hypothetical protein
MTTPNKLDDWRNIKAEIRRKAWEAKPHDYVVKLYLSEDMMVKHEVLVQEAWGEIDAIKRAWEATESHGIKVHGVHSCELWFPF